jgi:hypothetical protein
MDLPTIISSSPAIFTHTKKTHSVEFLEMRFKFLLSHVLKGWCTLLTQMKKWQPSIGVVTKSTFSARKELSLLMSYKNYMADNKVVGPGDRFLGGSLASTLRASGPTIRYFKCFVLKKH